MTAFLIVLLVMYVIRAASSLRTVWLTKTIRESNPARRFVMYLDS